MCTTQNTCWALDHYNNDDDIMTTVAADAV